MKRRRVRPMFWWLLIGVGLLGAARAIIPPVRREMQRRAVEAAISRFEISPSQEGVNELAQLLSEGAATSAQGERILKMVLYPRVITRSAYPLGRPPIFSIERPFPVHLPGVMVSRDVGMWIDGRKRQGGAGRGGGDFDTNPQFFRLSPEPREPGLYSTAVRCEYAVTRMVTKTSWSWNPLRGRLPHSLLPQKAVTSSSSPSEPDYTCRFNVLVQLRVVREHEADTIDLLSDPKLDEKMRREFIVSSEKVSYTYRTRAGKQRYVGGVEAQYSMLPSAVAFKATLRLANGDELTARQEYLGRYRARANTSGTFSIWPSDFLLEKTGEYNATLILTPDLDYAYEDPAIEAIWGGTLEFPISFSVYEEPQSQ